MSDNNVLHSQESERAGYEKRDINLLKVFIYGLLGIVVVIVLVLFMLDYFTATREELVYESVLKPESTALRELRAREEEDLNSYALIDEKQGRYRIPIARAMELLAEEAYRAGFESVRDRR